MRKFTRGKIEGFLRRYATTASVLDVGAGGVEYSALFPNRTTFDIDPARHPDIVGDAADMPFEDSSYEVIICSEVFEHLPDPQKVVGELRRVLKPGGLLVLTTRFAFPVHDAPGDYWRFTAYGLQLLFKGWEIESLEAETGPFGTIAVLLQRIMFQTDLRGGKITKAIVYLFALIFNKLDCLVLKQYGDIKRSAPESRMLYSGIFMACRNTKK